jgi:uncharacterized protein YjlB
MAESQDAPTVEEHRFVDDGQVPNNPLLPLIVYRGVLQTGADAAAACEALFAENGWTGAWRNGIYAHHHFHSTAHEVLGIAAGSARVRLGGEGGTTVELRAGDVVVIPAGVAHKSEGTSSELIVVGAYPRGQRPDLCKPGIHEHERTRANVAAVSPPDCDPVYGKHGLLMERWRATGAA